MSQLLGRLPLRKARNLGIPDQRSRPTPKGHPREYAFFARAGVLPREMNAAVLLQSVGRDMSRSVRAASRALRTTHLSGTAEALVVDRLLHSRLDYEMRVWPVDQGREFPIHLRSWIGMKPIESDPARQREPTRLLEAMDDQRRRDEIRYSVITDQL